MKNNTHQKTNLLWIACPLIVGVFLAGNWDPDTLFVLGQITGYLTLPIIVLLVLKERTRKLGLVALMIYIVAVLLTMFAAA